jgi:hypothetical protein
MMEEGDEAFGFEREICWLGTPAPGGLPLVDQFDERDLYTGLRSMAVRDRCANTSRSPTTCRTGHTRGLTV